MWLIDLQLQSLSLVQFKDVVHLGVISGSPTNFFEMPHGKHRDTAFRNRRGRSEKWEEGIGFLTRAPSIKVLVGG
jgi:hypothetical protein